MIIDTLQQNNTAMKQQLTTLTKLQEEVFKIHQSHKQKFEETKDLVLKVGITLNMYKRKLVSPNSVMILRVIQLHRPVRV